MRIFLSFLLLLFSLPLAAQNLRVDTSRRELAYTVRDSVDQTGNNYIHYWSPVPSVMTVVNGGGAVSVCAADEQNGETWVYEYSITGGSSLEFQKNLKFPNEYPMLGAFTKDGEGNYYFFYGQKVGANERNKENTALVKYNPEGEKLLSYKQKANAPNSFSGIMEPFRGSSCRLEVSGAMIAVYFGRKMFDGHQACYGVVLDKNTFERIDKGAATNIEFDVGWDYNFNGAASRKSPDQIMSYVSHSFNQFIVPVENGFVFADHGDAYPRCFTFARFLSNGPSKRLNAFTFSGSHGANATYAQMGGMAKTSAGFIFAGAYGNGAAKNARNLFVLTFDDNLTSCGKPVYLTKYTTKEGHVANPKIAPFGEGRFILLWEQCDFTNQRANLIDVPVTTGYQTTWALIIDETGNPLTEPQELPAVRLNMNDVLRYNRVTGKVYWAVNDGENAIVIYSLTETDGGASEEQAY